MQGTWKTTKGGGKVTVTAGGAAVVIGALYAFTHKQQAGEAVSGAVTVAAITAGVVLVSAVAAVVLYFRQRARNRPAAQPRQAPPTLMRDNPRAIPLPPRREIAAPVVNVNIGADLLAGLADLMHAAQMQPASVIVQSEQQEIPR